MTAQPGEPDSHPDPRAASTWVPLESPGAGTQPAWLPPGMAPGEAYGPQPGQPGPAGPMGQPYAAPPPLWEQRPPGPPPYGQATGPVKPRMPRWAKVVLVVWGILAVLGFIAQVLEMVLLSR